MAHLTQPVQLSAHVFILYSEFPHAHSGNVFLVTGEEPALIDCGSDRAVSTLVHNLSQLGLEVADIHRVIATHGDYDHVQGFHGLRQLNPNLRLHIHHEDLRAVQGADMYQTASYVYGRPFERFDPADCVPVDAGDTITAGDSSLTVLHTPGHTEGSICLIGDIDGHGILFAGDTVGGSMRSLDGATTELWVRAVRTWEQSLGRLAELDFDWVLNGHEPWRTLPIDRQRFDRMTAHFGKMLNPWFSLEESEQHATIGVPAPAV